jgi:hypothetical protein
MSGQREFTLNLQPFHRLAIDLSDLEQVVTEEEVVTEEQASDRPGVTFSQNYCALLLLECW